MLELLLDPQAWIALVTLTVLEVVLGIDNVIFISILSGNLPQHQQKSARRLGLGLAMFVRIALLFSLSWIIGLTAPLFTVLSNEISGRDLILIAGGLFLLGKATHEIHGLLEGGSHERKGPSRATFGNVLFQIALLDIIFSLDSVITAVGMVEQLWIMVTAVVLAVIFMVISAEPISAFVERHPTVKMLALSFLILIGMALVADGVDHHIPKGYIYFAMGFSVGVELLNQRLRRVSEKPVRLRKRLPVEPR